ncbi:MAG: fumarylacetoacetate hydrolase family protein [Anaerolineae bacterium]
MKLVRFRHNGNASYGVVEGEDVFQLRGDLFESPARGDRAGSLEEVQLLAPVEPSKIVGIGKNYVDHAAELASQVPDEPLMFFKPPSAVIGPGAGIVYPSLSQEVHHEGELVVVIGRRVRNATPDNALDYVLGYTCGNDVTARDLQRKENQWVRAKGFDTFCVLGPWVETNLDPGNLSVVTRVNGEVRQNGNTAQMAWDVALLVATASSVMTLQPGDVIMTGTPAGVGPIYPGDTVEVEIEGIGVLRNPVNSDQ